TLVLLQQSSTFFICSKCTCQTCLIDFFFQAEDGIRYRTVTGVQTCALPISQHLPFLRSEFAFRDRLGQTKTLVVPRQRTSLGDLPSAVPKAVLAERRGFRQKPVQRLWARRKSLQQLRLRPLPTEIRRKSILVLPRANQLLSAETPVLKLMQKSFEVAVPQIVGSGKRAAARLQRAQAQRSSREHFRLSGAAIPDHLWA